MITDIYRSKNEKISLMYLQLHNYLTVSLFVNQLAPSVYQHLL